MCYPLMTVFIFSLEFWDGFTFLSLSQCFSFPLSSCIKLFSLSCMEIPASQNRGFGVAFLFFLIVAQELFYSDFSSILIQFFFSFPSLVLQKEREIGLYHRGHPAWLVISTLWSQTIIFYLPVHIWVFFPQR